MDYGSLSPPLEPAVAMDLSAYLQPQCPAHGQHLAGGVPEFPIGRMCLPAPEWLMSSLATPQRICPELMLHSHPAL